MKESDYINATNLAKIRIAYSTLADVLTDEPEWKEALILIDKLREKYEKKVRG